MKTPIPDSFKALCFILLLFVLGSSCSKDKSPAVVTKPQPTFTAKIDSSSYSLDASAITSTYYSTTGDNVNALLTNTTLNTSQAKIIFFISDFKAGTITISKKAGTSLNPGNPALKTNATSTTLIPVQTYVQYIKAGNTYYAISGSITITISKNTATIKFSITFKDAAGKQFTATGTYEISDFTTNVKPKSQITDPTPIAAKPTIESISPQFGHGNDSVSITGVNYSTVLTDNVVKFNGLDAKVISATATKVIVKSPLGGSTGAITIKVKNSETVTGPIFKYIVLPTITSISPASGKAGDTVTITGNNFSSVLAENSVLFNSAKGTILKSTITKLTVKVPAGGHTGSITVAIALDAHNSQGVNGPVFTYATQPVLSYISPSTGRAGDVVTLNGSYFSTRLTDNVVTFNGKAATVLTATATKLTVQAPSGVTSGKVIVSVAGRPSVDNQIFTVDAPYPNIQWQEIYSNNNVQNITLMASLRHGLLFTGGLNPGYLYFSADDKTFTNVYSKLPFNKNKKLAIHLLSSDGTAFYVTSNLGVARSTDGQTWTKLAPNKADPDMGFTGIVSIDSRIYLLSGSTLFTSTNSGQTWVTSKATVPAPLDYFTSFPNSKYIFAADTSINTQAHDATKFYSSTSQGATWAQSYNQAITGVYHFDTGYKDFLKTSTYNTFCAFSPVSSPGLSSQRLYMSVNQGAQWNKVGDEVCYVVKTNGSKVGYGSKTFNLSTNDGVTFKSFSLPVGYTLGGIEFGSFIYISAFNSAGSHKIFRSSY